ncbi:MAG TPA: PLP-dependent transferase, partial [Chitinophagaceae bacterium]|nr:PLP-dependent transferase [Chitinophagaceae bacterium]
TRSTRQVVQFLKKHPKVEGVIFPFDESFPQYTLAKNQMNGACGLFTFIMKTEKRESIVTFCESLQHIMMAVSWGGHESLAIPKCAGISPKDFDPANKEHRYVRMYVGLEDPDYLIADLEQALSGIK